MSPIVVVVVAVVVVRAAARFGHDRNGGNETTTTTTMAMLLFRIHREKELLRGTQNTMRGEEGNSSGGRGACSSSTFAFTFRRFVCCGFFVLFVIFTLFCFHSFLSFAN